MYDTYKYIEQAVLARLKREPATVVCFYHRLDKETKRAHTHAREYVCMYHSSQTCICIPIQ